MSGPGDDHLTRARTELGEPDALFQVTPGLFRAKLGVGLGLVLAGVAANYWWWVHGPQNLHTLVVHLLLWSPLVGLALLVHMYRQRGLFVLLYPTGLLRLQRGEVDSYPWAEVAEIRLKVQRAETAEVWRAAAGNPTACWLPAEVPAVQIWNAWLTVERTDGTAAHFGPALADYAQLAEEIQRRTFPAAWAAAWGRLRAGETVAFTDLEATPAGLRFAGKVLPWREVKELTIAQGRLSVKQSGRWLPWAIKDVSVIPNPHVLFALVEEARRLYSAPAGQPQSDDADHDPDDEV